mmetsp:Transcript_22445/g.46555  ORF Transcript_22445/g.46555 Transcript_22445/m.46555 type:complete len:419 (+) Transcript_22445:1-1257(+)
MPLFAERDRTLDDVEVLGTWNFTLQGDTPLYWIKSGILDRYHMRFRMHTQCPSTCGIVIHGEADAAGTDGVSFWSERRKAKSEEEKDTRRYVLSGNGLDSRAIITRPLTDEGGSFDEEVEVLVQGYTGAIFLQNRKITLKFKMKLSRGCVAFYNSSSVKGGQDDVHFSDVRITALRRGPLELQGTLGKREAAIAQLDEKAELEEPAESPEDPEPVSEGVASHTAGENAVGGGPLAATMEPRKPGDGHHESRATVSTFAPSATDGRGGSSTFTSLGQTGARTAGSGFGSPKSSTWGGGATPHRGATTPSRQTPSRQGRFASPASGGSTPGRAWAQRSGGDWARKSPASPGFIRRSSSESTMRKTAGSMWGLPPAAAGANGRYAATKLNAPDKEHKVLQPALKPRGDGARTCADFIRVEQ